MAGAYKATIEELDALAKRIDADQAEINGLILGFNAVVDGVATAWQGEAAMAYKRLQEKVNELMKNLNVQLDGIGQMMGAGAKNYREVEEANKQQMASITAALG
ncbi:WXG100 family type VII secretion target [Yinghuangia seranimata]|uniref:WXG100 family type VII secretion target n=1 Tax=Yinghuangia seranimata TaxID=408067 RepID=UPI00248CF590|nr:WXG100 family type VII secretion target [Yinghuangia seranimata]MDI2132467.1 WXG100 family type VII secretion target [Yinghuangia seranimata]